MRYSRRRGPPADFELVGLAQLITGFRISRYWDEGELFIGISATVTNTAGGTCRFEFIPRLDSVPFGPITLYTDIPNNTSGRNSATFMQPITQGPHTIELYASGIAAVGDRIIAGSAEFLIIQLGVWDSIDDIINL